MIIDTLPNRFRYSALHTRFAQAFELLGASDLAAMAPGRHTIDGDRIYISIDQAEGRGRERARLESHREYIDIQVPLEGQEEIGWRPVASCGAPLQPFDADRDIGFFEDTPLTWLIMPPGHFAIFFPEDAHAPLGGRGLLKKAIVKVAVT